MSWLLQCPEGQGLAVPPGTDLTVGADAGAGLRLRGAGVPSKLAIMSATDDDVWLRVMADDPPVGVNGRPVRALARLVAGDRVCFGAFCVDLAGTAPTGPTDPALAVDSFVLRARGGASGGVLHHGPMLSLDAAGAVVSAASGVVELTLVDGTIRLGTAADVVVRVNGHAIAEPVELKAMDQVQVGASRYLVEVVSARVVEPVTERLAVLPDAIDQAIPQRRRGDVGALWWLIGIAALIAALVSALMYFHV